MVGGAGREFRGPYAIPSEQAAQQVQAENIKELVSVANRVEVMTVIWASDSTPVTVDFGKLSDTLAPFARYWRSEGRVLTHSQIQMV